MDSISSYLFRYRYRVLLVVGLFFSSALLASEANIQVELSGELKYATIFDFKSAARQNDLQDDIDGDHLELTIGAQIFQGPFSGVVLFEEYDDDAIDPLDTAALLAQNQSWRLTIKDLKMYEGDLVFGQLNPVNTTDDYVALITDDLNEGLGYGSMLGVRYYDPELPLVAQFDANYVSDSFLPDFENDNFWGVSANYLHQTGESDIHADIHIADDPDNIMRPIFIGVAGDIRLNQYYRSSFVFQRAYDMTFGVRIERQIDTKFWYAQWADPSWEAKKDTITKIGRIYDSPYTPLIYTLELTRISTNTLWLESRIDYKKEKRGAYVEFAKSFIAEDSASEVGGGVTHLNDTGLLYAVKYFNRIENAPSNLPGIQAENYFELSVEYGF